MLLLSDQLPPVEPLIRGGGRPLRDDRSNGLLGGVLIPKQVLRRDVEDRAHRRVRPRIVFRGAGPSLRSDVAHVLERRFVFAAI